MLFCYYGFRPLSIAITSFVEERANLSAVLFVVCLLNLRLFGFVCFLFLSLNFLLLSFQKFHRKYLLVPVDKSANNVMFFFFFFFFFLFFVF